MVKNLIPLWRRPCISRNAIRNTLPTRIGNTQAQADMP